MKFKKNFKKGFTLVELIVVIAIVAILAAVSVVSYIAFINSANESADIQLVKQLNTCLQADEALHGTRANMTEMLSVMEDNGFIVENLTKTKSGNDIVWDEQNNRFALVKADKTPLYGESKFNEISNWKKWYFVDTKAEAEDLTEDHYSIYLTKEFGEIDALTINAGLDVGINLVKSVTYINTNSQQDIVLRTNGGSLNAGNTTAVAAGQIYHYGVLKDSTIYVENSCFHTHGAIGHMNLHAGKAIADEGGLVYLVNAVAQEGKTVEIKEENNGKFFIPEDVTTEEVPASVAAGAGYTVTGDDYSKESATKAGGNVYEIPNLAALEQFRDLVNSGFNFDGIAVKLTSDITLNDGWTPIGEGSRKAAINTDVGSEGWKYSGNVYKGEFDGNKHKIYNLNNKGYVPSLNCLGDDGSDLIYCYGLFSIVAGNANIHDLELVNVDIDTSRYQSAIDNIKGDCVAAVVGFSAGSLTVNNVHVSGNSSIKGYSAVSSIIGKLYKQDGTTTDSVIIVNNCSSNATVEVLTNHYAAGIAGHFGNTINKVTITNNTFTGTIKTLYNNAENNNAGIAILDGKFAGENNDNFIHYGNVNDSTQIWKNGTYQANLFLQMSTNTHIESTRNVDNTAPQD